MPRFLSRHDRRLARGRVAGVLALVALVAALAGMGVSADRAEAVGDYQYFVNNQSCFGGQSTFIGYGYVRWNLTVNAGSGCNMFWGNTGANAGIFKLSLNHSRNYSGTGSREIRVFWNDATQVNSYGDGPFVTHQEPPVGNGYNTHLQVIQTANRTYTVNGDNNLATSGAVIAHVSDNEGPGLSGVAVSCPQGGRNGWCRGGQARADFTSSDNYLGRQGTLLYIDGGLVGSWDQSVTGHSYTATLGDGARTFQARRGGDHWGTAASDQAFYIDSAGPSLPANAALSASVANTAPVQVDFDAFDSLSGAAESYVYWNSATDGSQSGTWNAFAGSCNGVGYGAGNGHRTCSIDPSVMSAGTHAIAINQFDWAGNQAGNTYLSLVVDRTPPSAPTVSGGSAAWQAGPVTISAAGSSDTGGSTLAGYQYRASSDGGVTWAIGGANGTDGASVEISRAGDWTVQFRAVDAVGNSSAWVGAQARVDGFPPSIPVVSGGSATWQDQASVTVSASGSSDPQSESVSYQSRISSDGGATWSAPAPGSDRAVSDAGETLVQFRAVDGFGNPSAWVWAGPDAVRAPGPLAYYRFNESSGLDLVDYSGNARSGRYGAPVTLGTAGRPASGEADTAASFNGTTASASVPPAPISNAFGVSVWIKADALKGDYQTILDKGPCCAESYALYVGPNGELHGATTLNGVRRTFLSAASTITPGLWYHVAWTYDGSAQRVYLNGDTGSPLVNQAVSGTVAAGAAADQLHIGMNAAGGQPFGGTIDELSLYGSALSTAQVSALFSAGPDFGAGTVRIDRGPPGAPALSGGSLDWRSDSTVSVTGSGSGDDAGAPGYQHRVSRDGGATWLAPATGAIATVPGPAGVADLALWLRADQLDLPQGAAVSSWSDSSSSDQGATQTQSQPLYQPAYQQSAIGGKPALRFDGNDYLGNSGLTLGSQVSVFAVASPRSASAGVHRRIFNNEMNLFLGSFDNSFASFYGNGGAWGTSAGHGAAATLAVDQPYVLSSVNNGTDTAYVNGVRVGSRANPMSGFSDGYRVGCLQGAGGCLSGYQGWDGDIAEIIVVNRAVNAAERLEIERYLLAKYGLSVPPSHRGAGEGQSLVQVRALDRAGNASAWTPAHAGAPSSPDAAGTVRIDRLAPSAPTLTGGSTSFRNVAGLSLTAAGSTDTSSGLLGYEHRTSIDSGASWSAPVSGATFTQNSEGDTLVQFRARDNAGNVSQWVGDYATEVLADGPVGYWRLSEGSGSAADASGFGHGGSYLSTTAQTAGALASDQNGATTFTGGGSASAAGGYVNVPATTTLNTLTSGWTIDGWIKTASSAPANQMILEKYDWAPGYGGYILRLQGNRLVAYNIRGQGGDSVTGSTVITPGTWYHVAATYDAASSQLKVYVNGILDGQVATANAPLASSLSLKIGAEGDNGLWRFLGEIDDVAVYPQALPAGRIGAHYAAGTRRWSAYDTVRDTAGAVGYWRLGEASGASAADDSGNGRTGTYTGGFTQGAPGAVVSDPDTATTFNGGHVTIPDAASLRPSRVSVQAWVKTTDTGVGGAVVSKTTGCSSAGYLIQINPATGAGRPGFYVGGMAAWMDAGVNVADGQWHQIVGTYDGTTARIYVDGRLRNSIAVGANPQGTGPLVIGSGVPVSCGSGFTGSVDEVAVFDGAIDESRVSELYQAGTQRFGRVRIERTGPSIPSVAGGSLAWTNASSVTVSASGSSAPSGIAGYEHRVSRDGGSTWLSPVSGADAVVPSAAGVPDLALWLRADQVNLSQGASVATWRDASSGAHHASQPTAGARPTFQASAFNGRPALRFDGNDILDSPNVAIGSQVSVFAVASARSASPSQHRRIINNEFNLFLGSFSDNFASFYGNGSGWGTASNHGAPLAVNQPYLMSSVNNGTDTAYLNGLQVGSRSNPMSAFSDGLKVGCIQGAGASCSGQGWDGDIAEIIVVNRAVTAAERLEIERYLLDKYGLAVPASHLGAGEGQALVQFRARAKTNAYSAWAPAHSGAPSAPDSAGTVRIDRTSPSAPTVAGGSLTWRPNAVNFTPTGAVDTGGSGLVEHQARIWHEDDQTWGAPQSFASASFTVAAEGLTHIQIRAVDGAGNTSAWSPSYESAVLSDSPRGYWRLGETSGPAVDRSGVGNDLSYAPGVTRGAPSLLASDPDRSVVVDGTVNGRVTSGATITGVATTNQTLETWVTIPSLPARGSFLKVHETGIGIGGSNFDNTGSRLLGIFEAIRWVDSGYDFPAPGTYHVVMSVDGSGTARFYVNGSLVGTSAGSAPIGGSGVSVGGYGNCRCFTGTVDEAAVYGSVLSLARIQAHYAAASGVANLARIDTTPPSLPTVAGGSELWRSDASVTVSASASTDARSGLAGYEYRTSTTGGASWSSPSGGASIAVDAEGETLVQFRSVDVAGNRSAWTPTATVRLDRTPPGAPAVTGGSSSWQSVPSITFNAIGSDGGSGVAGYDSRISTDGGATWSAPLDGDSRQVSAEGETRIQFRTRDGVGNLSDWFPEAVTSGSIARIDRTPPSGMLVTGGSDDYRFDATVTVSAADAGDLLSGLDRYEYRVSLDAGGSFGPVIEGDSVELGSEGDLRVEFRAVDAAGNHTGWASARVRLDNVAPQLSDPTFTPGPGSEDHLYRAASDSNVWFNATTPGSVLVAAGDGSDGGYPGGVTTNWPSGPGIVVSDQTFNRATFSWAPNASDAGVESLIATDAAGLESNPVAGFTLRGDAQAPQLELATPAGSGAGAPDAFVSESPTGVRIAWAASDEGSGLRVADAGLPGVGARDNRVILERRSTPADLSAGCPIDADWDELWTEVALGADGTISAPGNQSGSGAVDDEGAVLDAEDKSPMCFQWRLSATDAVGNQTSALSGRVLVASPNPVTALPPNRPDGTSASGSIAAFAGGHLHLGSGARLNQPDALNEINQDLYSRYFVDPNETFCQDPGVYFCGRPWGVVDLIGGAGLSVNGTEISSDAATQLRAAELYVRAVRGMDGVPAPALRSPDLMSSVDEPSDPWRAAATPVTASELAGGGLHDGNLIVAGNLTLPAGRNLVISGGLIVLGDLSIAQGASISINKSGRQWQRPGLIVAGDAGTQKLTVAGRLDVQGLLWAETAYVAPTGSLAVNGSALFGVLDGTPPASDEQSLVQVGSLIVQWDRQVLNLRGIGGASGEGLGGVRVQGVVGISTGG